MNPLKTHLHILQLEGYEPLRFLRWWFAHPATFKTGVKKPLVYTFKIKLILTITFLLCLGLALVLPFPINLAVIAFLAFQPFPLLLLSLFLIKPYEISRRFATKFLVRRQIKRAHLSVTGVTGSYGKTSAKDFLSQILRRVDQTLKTPESYNTVFGIAKVIKLELHRKLHYFVCEMGAYVRGEIKELAWMVPPDYAILTAIGNQHLERFKTLENTTLAKFELVDAVRPENALVNLDNKYIRDHLADPRYQKVKTYSFRDPRADFFVRQFTLNPKGTEFILTHKNRDYSFTTKLFGTSNLENLIGAIGLAFMLDIGPKTIQYAVAQINPSPHRLELIHLDIPDKTRQPVLIDNAYSSNELGFSKIMVDLARLPGKKALVTPGIIELGSHTAAIHEKLGRTASHVFDHIVLVGRSDRTENFARGVAGQTKLEYLDDNSSVWPTIDALARKHDWILLENDLPDNF